MGVLAVGGGFGCAGGEFFAELVLALFVFFQDFAGAFDDAAGEAGEAGDFDAVAFVGAAGFDVAEEDDFVGSFFHRDVDVFYGGQKFGEFGEFVIVGGEERAGAGVFLQVLDDGPGDGEAVEGGGAAADFVEQDEACGRGVIEDAGDFAHFDEERGAAAGEIVAGADAREDAIDDGKFGLARGNEASRLAPSATISAVWRRYVDLPPMLGPVISRSCWRVRLEVEIVGNEALAALAQKFFDDRMAAADDQELAAWW